MFFKAKQKIKALVLLSGGLDSILAAKILKTQGIKVTALSFKSYFFDERAARDAARKLGIKLKVADFSEDHLETVKRPKYGYGKTMNPCIDCHILMLKKAKEMMQKEKFNFVATGEVLWERPMSQNPKALKIVEKESFLKGYLLRPLSARVLEETIPEKKGWVQRKKLLCISGRSRKPQIELAKKFKIDWYPTPAGGCCLTDHEFGKRLKELFEKYPKCDGNDILLLKFGRHIWPFDRLRVNIVVGRNEEENKKIKKLAKRGDILIEMKNYPGPMTLIRNYSGKKISPKVIKKACVLTQYYSTKTRHLTKIIKFDIIKSTEKGGINGTN